MCMRKIIQKTTMKMAGILENRESELLGSELGAMHHVCEMEKEKFAKQLLNGMGKEITSARPVKRKKPFKMRIKEWFRRFFGYDNEEIYRKLSDIEKGMTNYKMNNNYD